MRLSTSLPALAALVSVLAASDVLDLTKSSFKGEVLGEDLALVEFFAPCKLSTLHFCTLGSSGHRYQGTEAEYPRVWTLQVVSAHFASHMCAHSGPIRSEVVVSFLLPLYSHAL
jgi:hypothetical protein